MPYARRSSTWMRMGAARWTTEPACRAPALENSVIPRHRGQTEARSSLSMRRGQCAYWLLRGCYIGEVGLIKAIPKTLLIHTVTQAREGEADRWGNGELAGEQELQHVRMEPSSRIIRDKNGAEIQLAATLFYDCRNSRPKNILFQTDDIIIFNGQRYKVQTVEPLYDGARIHHYELGLIRHA